MGCRAVRGRGVSRGGGIRRAEVSDRVQGRTWEGGEGGGG